MKKLLSVILSFLMTVLCISFNTGTAIFADASVALSGGTLTENGLIFEVGGDAQTITASGGETYAVALKYSTTATATEASASVDGSTITVTPGSVAGTAEFTVTGGEGVTSKDFTVTVNESTKYALTVENSLSDMNVGGITFTVNNEEVTSAAGGATVKAEAIAVTGMKGILESSDVTIAADGTFTMPKGDVKVSVNYESDETNPITETGVAQIGDTTYETVDAFKTAWAAISGNATVKLLGAVDLGSSSLTVASGQNITLDLNGCTISSTASTIITVNGTLTVNDDSTNMNGMITCSGGYYDPAIDVNGGTLNFNSGNVKATGSSCYGIRTYQSSDWTTNGTVTINGGTFKASYAPVYAYYGSTTINGGYFQGTVRKYSGTLTLNGGYYTVSPSSATYATGKELLSKTTTYKDVEYSYTVDVLTEEYAVAKIGDNLYSTIDKAYSAADAGATITLLKDCPASTAYSKEVTYVSKSGENFILTSSKKISAGTFNCTVTSSSYITGGTFNGDVTSTGYISGGTFAKDIKAKNISDGTYNVAIEATGTISGGTFNNAVTGTSTITDGTFNAAVTASSIKGGLFVSQPTPADGYAYAVNSSNNKYLVITSANVADNKVISGAYAKYYGVSDFAETTTHTVLTANSSKDYVVLTADLNTEGKLNKGVYDFSMSGVFEDGYSTYWVSNTSKYFVGKSVTTKSGYITGGTFKFNPETAVSGSVSSSYQVNGPDAEGFYTVTIKADALVASIDTTGYPSL